MNPAKVTRPASREAGPFFPVQSQDELAGRPRPQFLDLGAPARVADVRCRQTAAAEAIAGVFRRQDRQCTEARKGDVGESQRLAGQVTPAVGEQLVHLAEGFARARPGPVCAARRYAEHPPHGKGQDRSLHPQQGALPAWNGGLVDAPRAETQIGLVQQVMVEPDTHVVAEPPVQLRLEFERGRRRFEKPCAITG